jgi:hypothetical protein
MTRSDDQTTIELRENGRMLAAADVRPAEEPGVVRSDLHVESGQLPEGTRTRLVDAVLDLPQVDEAQRLVATMPISDTEMLDRVRERCHDVETHSAGATKIVDARLAVSDGPAAERPQSGATP